MMFIETSTTEVPGHVIGRLRRIDANTLPPTDAVLKYVRAAPKPKPKKDGEKGETMETLDEVEKRVTKQLADVKASLETKKKK